MGTTAITCSVALCTCNGARFLAEQLASIAAQSMLPSELVICDDASEDGTLRIAEAFAGSVPFNVRVYKNKTRLGVTKNFERAIGLCTGEVIVLADQDDVWVPGKLEKQMAVFASDPRTGMVFSDADLVDASLRPLPAGLWGSIRFTAGERRMARKGRMLEVLLRHAAVTGATMAFRAELRKIVLPIPEDWMHDAWIALVASSCSEVVAIDEPLIKYRQHGSNQIGARHKGLVQLARETGVLKRSDYYGGELQRYREACARISNLASWEANADVRALFAGKLGHIEARNRLPANRWLRIFGISNELIRLHYFRFSYGWQVAIRDFLLPDESCEAAD